MVESEAESTVTTEKEITAWLETNAKAIGEAEGRQNQREQRHQELRIASEALTERQDLLKHITALTAERDRQALDRSEADARLAAIESDLSKALGGVSEAKHSATSLDADVTKIQDLLTEFPQFELDLGTLADIRSRLEEARLRLRNADERQAQAAVEVRSASASREAVVPEYERALSQQAGLENASGRHSGSCARVFLPVVRFRIRFFGSTTL